MYLIGSHQNEPIAPVSTTKGISVGGNFIIENVIHVAVSTNTVPPSNSASFF
jgi:hypothetical protein